MAGRSPGRARQNRDRDRRLHRRRRFVNLLAILLLAAAGALAGYALAPLPPQQLPAASRIYAFDGRLVTRLGTADRVPVPLAQIPLHLQQAVIAVEDARFYRHFGLDPIGIARALARNLREGRIVEGASTLTQQVARTLYLNQDRTVTRKLKEALLAIKLETHLSKSQILEHYLNSLYMGHGAWGMETAAQNYFGKPVSDVNLAEAALLAGIIAGPEYFSPYRDLDAALRRQQQALARMVELDMITPDQAAAAAATELRFPGLRGPAAGRYEAYFIDYMRHELARILPEVAADLHHGGYRIETTLDPVLQQAAVTALRDGLGPPTREDAQAVAQPQGALVAIEPATGHIRALVGGRDYGGSPFNRAYQALRQPGSAFKPFVYAAAIDHNIAPTAIQACAPVQYPGGAGRPPYEPRDHQAESGQPYHYEYLTMREALAISDNVVAVRWAREVGARTVADYARRLGISETTELEPTLPIALGASAVTPLELAQAYATLANLGERVEATSILRVLDQDGQVLYERRPQRRQALAPDTAYIVTDLLKNVLAEGGTGARVRQWFQRPAAGKTGTTDGLRNAWFAGYTPQLAAVVYAGHDDEAPLGGTGGSIAGPIWARFMAAAHEALPVVDWQPPQGVVTATVCTLGGSIGAPYTRAVTEVFRDHAVSGDVECLAPPGDTDDDEVDDDESEEDRDFDRGLWPWLPWW